LIGGLLVSGAEAAGVDRIMALRLPFFFAGVALFLVFIWAAPKLTTAKIEAARSEGVAAKEAAVESEARDEAVRDGEPEPNS
jgi:hypothetical protein